VADLINFDLNATFGDKARDEENELKVCEAVLKRCKEILDAGDPEGLLTYSVREFMNKKSKRQEALMNLREDIEGEVILSNGEAKPPGPDDIPAMYRDMSKSQAEVTLKEIERDLTHPVHHPTDSTHEQWTRIVEHLQGIAYPFGESYTVDPLPPQRR